MHYRAMPVAPAAGLPIRLYAHWMADPIPVIGDVRDMCSESGYQWEFRCTRCSTGYRSPFEQNLTGHGRSLLRMAGHWFGGKVATASYTMDSASSNRYGDGDGANKNRHYAKAVEAMLPQFRQCRGCNRWTCAQQCWNEPAGQCLECAPARQRPAQQPGKAQCTSCGAYGSGKFCPKCGAGLAVRHDCPQCGTPAVPGAMFCEQCGNSLGPAAAAPPSPPHPTV